MKVVTCFLPPSEGTVRVNGYDVRTDALEVRRQIGYLPEHTPLYLDMRVYDYLGFVAAMRGVASDRRDRRIADMAEVCGLGSVLQKPIEALSKGYRQRVGLAQAMIHDPEILILDEPTAVLTPQEADSLFATLKSLTAKGLAVIFISHKLHEILSVSDRVAVLRRGAMVGTVATKDADKAQLAEMMVGRTVIRPKPEPMQAGMAILEIAGLTTSGGAATALADVDLTIHAHEIVGIAGVSGNGQQALADVLCGLISGFDGTVRLHGKPLPAGRPRAIVNAGVGRIPEDRHARGVVGDMEIWENLISEDLRSDAISRWGIVNRNSATARAEQQIAEFDVRCEGPDAETKLLSGGNMQKLILARALSREPSFILANQPVRGLDEGAIAYVQEQLLKARARGAAILLISEDLDELMALSDRIAVLSHGRLSEALPGEARSVAEIGLMMAGQDGGEKAA